MNPLVNLAKQAVENYINDNIVIIPPTDLPKEFFEKKAGVFVTIMKDPARNASPHSDAGGGELRGCIGTYSPTRKNIAEEIIYNAVAAATEDYRFGKIKKEELPHLSYEISILNIPEKIDNIKDPAKSSEEEFRRAGLDPKKYGIIVMTNNFPIKSALLLPDLEEVNTTEQQIAICCQKGGIDSEKEKLVIYKFTVEKIKDDDK